MATCKRCEATVPLELGVFAAHLPKCGSPAVRADLADLRQKRLCPESHQPLGGVATSAAG
jgi:hypothetical protein